MRGLARGEPVMPDDEWGGYYRRELIPGPLAHGPYADLDLEARRLSRFVRAEDDRQAISARRAGGWRPADEAIARAEAAWLERVSSGADFRAFTANAERYRQAAEAWHARIERPG